MPQTDLSLDQLYGLAPETIEPDDFDAFWRAGLDDASASPLDAEFVEIETPLREIRVFDVSFAGYGADRIRGWLLLPRSATSSLPCVVSYVGYGGGRGRAISWTAVPATGMAQFVMDTRGQGSHFQPGATPDPHGSGPRAAGFVTSGIESREDYYYRRVFLDAARAIDAAAAHPLIDGSRIVAHGESQGGAIALAATALSGRPRAVVSEVTFLSDVRRAVRLASEGPTLELVRYFATHGDEVGLATLAYFDATCFARRITVPGQFAIALMDTVCPPSTVYAAHNVFAGPRELRLYPYNGHEHGRDAQLQARLDFIARMVG